MKKQYRIGNMLRGYYYSKGKNKNTPKMFATIEEAWDSLGAMFDKHYPSSAGRSVNLKVREEIYGIDQWVLCKNGTTKGNRRRNKDNIKFGYQSSILQDLI
jgi:hypothetical protein